MTPETASERRDRRVVRAVLPGLVLVAVGLAVFFSVLDAVRERDDLWHLDQPVLDWLVAHRTDAWTAVLATITFVSGPVILPIVVGVGALIWGLVRREWWRPLLLAGAMLGSSLLGLAVKGLVDRPRPPNDTMVVPGAELTASFPSGHTLGTATLLLVLGYLVCSRRPTPARLVAWGVVTVVGTTAVALSRLYLGYHFLTDVVAAVALAVAVLGVVSIIDRLHTASAHP
ncbi:phosphatase PAP2 family protein [Cellulomonas sp. McL0617]|uniref:phosphatase PAP2 family protein n=1 Tax=Cellulomonas sp. McL0617 TaxID=3415675 RepID=UPI003CF25993